MKTVVLRNTCVLMIAAIMVGCSGGTETLHKVSGTVSYQGKPVPNVNVMFTPEGDTGSGRPGIAVTDAAGKFDSATTYEAGDGVIPGSHTVTLAVITKESDSSELAEDTYAEATTTDLPFPIKYLNTVESGLTVEISTSGQVVDIQLTD